MEGDAIAEDPGEAFGFPGLLLFGDLTDGFVAGLVHPIICGGFFAFDDHHPPVFSVAQIHIGTAEALLPVGLGNISATGKDPGEEGVIIIFMIISVHLYASAEYGIIRAQKRRKKRE